MIRVVLLGLGNVGFHLAKAFIGSDQIELVQVYNRTIKEANLFDEAIPITDKIRELKAADVYVISISDDAISNFSAQLQFKQGLVVHTSGTASLDALKCKANKGVFYPVQTFTKNQEVDFHSIPIAFEVEKEIDYELLNKLSKSISDQVFRLSDKQRRFLHIAAVFTNNFSNHMYKIAYDICEENKMSFDLLKPLIMETAIKAQSIIPIEAQTGPAIRNDNQTIQNHMETLDNNRKEIYTLVTKEIKDSLKRK